MGSFPPQKDNVKGIGIDYTHPVTDVCGDPGLYSVIFLRFLNWFFREIKERRGIRRKKHQCESKTSVGCLLHTPSKYAANSPNQEEWCNHQPEGMMLNQLGCTIRGCGVVLKENVWKWQCCISLHSHAPRCSHSASPEGPPDRWILQVVSNQTPLLQYLIQPIHCCHIFFFQPEMLIMSLSHTPRFGFTGPAPFASLSFYPHLPPLLPTLSSLPFLSVPPVPLSYHVSVLPCGACSSHLCAWKIPFAIYIYQGHHMPPLLGCLTDIITSPHPHLARFSSWLLPAEDTCQILFQLFSFPSYTVRHLRGLFFFSLRKWTCIGSLLFDK